MKKANSITGLIKRNYMDKNNVLTLYKSLIRPHLDYGKKYKTSGRIKGFVMWKATRRTQPSYIRILLTTIWLFYIRCWITNLTLTTKMFYVTNVAPWNKRKSIQDSETTCKQNCSSQLFFSHRVINNWNNLASEHVCAESVTIVVTIVKTKLDQSWISKWFHTASSIA